MALATALSIYDENEPHGKRIFLTLEAEFVVGTVFLAYDPVQPENYDATLGLNEYDEEKLETTSCTSGVNSADQIRKSCIPFTNYNKCYIHHRHAHQSIDETFVQILVEKREVYHQNKNVPFTHCKYHYPTEENLQMIKEKV